MEPLVDILVNTATEQERLHCNHSDKTSGKEGRCKLVRDCVCVCEQQHHMREEGLHGSVGQLSYWGHTLPRSPL